MQFTAIVSKVSNSVLSFFKLKYTAEVTGTDVALSFTLPPGHYATTVAREYMQAEPECMV